MKDSQIRFIGLGRQQTEAVIQKVNLVTKQKMDSVGKKNRLSEDDGASISMGLSPLLHSSSGINQSLLQEYTEISPPQRGPP